MGECRACENRALHDHHCLSSAYMLVSSASGAGSPPCLLFNQLPAHRRQDATLQRRVETPDDARMNNLLPPPHPQIPQAAQQPLHGQCATTVYASRSMRSVADMHVDWTGLALTPPSYQPPKSSF